MARRSPGPVSPSTAIGRSPGSDVRSVGRSAPSGSTPRALSRFSRTVSTVFDMSVPQLNRSVVVASPLRATERTSSRPGVLPTAFSIGSDTNRDTSSGAAPGYMVRIVSTGRATSGSSDTGMRPRDTAPRSTSPRVAAMVATGRRSAVEANDIGAYCSVSRVDTRRTGAWCVSVRWPSTSTMSPALSGTSPLTESASTSVWRSLLRPALI
jgi:hypothetical protein